MMEATLVKSKDPDIFVHAWTPSRTKMNPSTFIPMSYAKKAAKGLAVRRTYKGQKQVAFYASGHPTSIFINGDLAHADMRIIAVYALEIEDMLNRWIGGAPQQIPYTIKFFKDEKEFKRVATRAGAANAMSYYSPATKDVVMWFDKTISYDDLQGLLAHEITHAYMDLVFKCGSPLWFAEGMAEYAQHFTWKKDHAVAGALGESMLKILRMGISLPVDEFVRLGRKEMYGNNHPTLYAQAWSLVHFLSAEAPWAIQELLQKRSVNVDGLERGFQGHLASMRGF